MANRKRRKRHVINTSASLHSQMVRYWGHEVEKWQSHTQVIPTIVERHTSSKYRGATINEGDALVARVRDIFHNGFGIKWSEVQQRIFEAFLFTCLPLIYGDSWQENKTRVLEEWDKEKAYYYTLVNMARRNGKTFSVSGSAAALLLAVPNVKIAVFSTCQRTSQMMMTEVLARLDQAFDKGTHVSRQDFVQIVRNMENVMYEGPDGSKRLLGSFPGSVRVRFSFSLSLSLVSGLVVQRALLQRASFKGHYFKGKLFTLYFLSTCTAKPMYGWWLHTT